jgi:hypothetical protein
MSILEDWICFSLVLFSPFLLGSSGGDEFQGFALGAESH